MSSLRDSKKECKKDLSSLKDAIDKALDCLTSTPNKTIIKLLHLQKLLEISGCEDGRLLLSERYVPEVGYILNMQSSQYVKYKLLEVLAITCSISHSINFWIYEISEDKELVEFIFRSFAKSVTNKNFRLQNTLLELLSSIFFEFGCHGESELVWIDYFRNLNYDFGSALINMLLQRTILHYTDVDVVISILGSLNVIFKLRIPDLTDMLERLFKIDNVAVVLLKKFSTFFCVTDRHCTKHWKTHCYWTILVYWLKLTSIVTNLQSFRRNPCYYDIRIRIVHILIYILRSFIYIIPVNDLNEFYVSNISQNGRQEMTFGPDATYRSITLLLRFFLVHKNLLNITEVINDIVNRVHRYLKYTYIIERNHFLEERGTLQILDYLEEYHEYLSMIERSYKNIPEEELIWAQHHNISPNDTYTINFRVKSTSNVQRNTEKCKKELMLMNNIDAIYSKKKQNHSQRTNIYKENICKYEILARMGCLIH